MARVFSWIIEADKIGYAYITNGKSGTAEAPLLTIEKLGDETDEFKSIFRRANSMPKADYERLFYKMKGMISDEFNVTMEGESEDYFGEDQNYILLSGRDGTGYQAVETDNLADEAVTEPKLSSDLQSKVNNNVKYVEQNLNNSQAKIAAKNVLMKDADGNFYLGSDFYSRAITSDSTAKPSHCAFGTNFRDNKFTGSGDKSHNTFGNNVYENGFQASFAANTVGNNVNKNVFRYNARHNTIGNNVRGNTFYAAFDSNQIGNDILNNIFGRSSIDDINDCVFGNRIENCYFDGKMKNCRLDGDMKYVHIVAENADTTTYIQNIHVLSGIKGESDTNRLTISIPYEHLNSSRELIITTKATNGGVSTFDDIVMYYADEVVDKQNKTDAALATTDKTIVGAINELKASSVGGNFEWSYSSDTESSKIYVQIEPTYEVPNGAEGGDFTVGETLTNMPIFVMEYQTSDNRKLKRYLDPYLSWKPFSTIGPQPTGEYTWLPVIAYANRSGLTFYNKITGLYLVKKNGEFLQGSNGGVAFYTFNKNGQVPQSTDVPTTTYANTEPIYIIGGQDSTKDCGWDMSETFTVKNVAEDILVQSPLKIDTTDNDFITAGYSVDTGGDGADGSAYGIKLDSSKNKFTIFEITFKLAQFGEGGKIEFYATHDINEKEYYFGIQGAINENDKAINYLIKINSYILGDAETGTAAWTAETSTDRSLLTIMNETAGINTNSPSKFVEYYDAASATPPITDNREVSYLTLGSDSSTSHGVYLVQQKFYPIGRSFVKVTRAGSDIAYYLGYIGQK